MFFSLHFDIVAGNPYGVEGMPMRKLLRVIFIFLTPFLEVKLGFMIV